MQFDLMYVILPAIAGVLCFILGRVSKNILEETYEDVIRRLRKENTKSKQKLELAEAALRNEKYDRFDEKLERARAATSAKNLWLKINEKTSLPKKNIKYL